MSNNQVLLNQDDIKELLPHRPPFLFLDSVVELEKNEKIVCERFVSPEEVHFEGHFPGRPVFPGVLMVEAVAQAGGALCRKSFEGKFENFILSEVRDTRFKRIVKPGDTLKITCKIDKIRKVFYWMSGEITVDGELAASVSFTALMS